jgi:hypothetical protein
MASENITAPTDGRPSISEITDQIRSVDRLLSVAINCFTADTEEFTDDTKAGDVIEAVDTARTHLTEALLSLWKHRDLDTDPEALLAEAIALLRVLEVVLSEPDTVPEDEYLCPPERRVLQASRRLVGEALKALEAEANEAAR